MKLRIRILLIFLLLSIILAGDQRILQFPEIKVGYASDGGIGLMEWSIRRGLGGGHVVVKEYVYDDEVMMLRDLSSSVIDIILLENRRILFDNKITDIGIILELKLKDYTEIAVCVKKCMLEEDLDPLFRFAGIIGISEAENDEYVLIQPEEWMMIYRKMGYEEERIMEYLVLDFQVEVLKR